jgi:hypothetical protein
MNKQGTDLLNQTIDQKRPLGLLLIAAFMILAGVAEVVTGFRHNFFGVITSSQSIFTYSSAVIGLIYASAGVLILTMKKWAAGIAILLLAVDAIGRAALVGSGLYPMESTRNSFAIIAGTAIVALIAIYIGIMWKSFR